jgi:hypothetical protein
VVLALDSHDEEEFPPRRPFGEPSGQAAPEPAEDDDASLPSARACCAAAAQAPMARS